MNQLTIEERAKAYDMALNRAREVIDNPNASSVWKDWLKYTFPELKELGDARIRKEIIEFLQLPHQQFVGKRNHEEWIAWLEKQGEQGPFNYESTNIQQKDFTQKVKPKFHEGDWVIDKQGIVHQIAKVVEIVTNHTYGYDIVGGGYFNDNTEGVRRWTIQDAKDGDVLATENFIFIFKSIDVCSGVHYYCHYEISKHEDDNQFGIALPQSLMGVVGDSFSHYSPATKEQRDQLETTMANNGYKWNKEEHKLEKM